MRALICKILTALATLREMIDNAWLSCQVMRKVLRVIADVGILLVMLSLQDLRMLRLQYVLFVLIATVAQSWANAGDLEDLQGAWETTFEQNGKTYRAVKTIKDRNESVEVYDGQTLMKKHDVEFEVKDDGEVKTLKYRNGRITFGAGSPAKLPDGKYIYRLDKDNWVGIFGALSADTGPVYMQTFKRVVESKTPSNK